MGPEGARSICGTVLEGRYLVLGALGRGGMGDVYLGEDTRLKRRCALKVLHRALAEDRTNVERFLREAQMIASLGHRNIVDIYSFGEEPSGLVYFAMELLTGEDLDARLKSRGARPFGVHDCCVWAIQIAQAVAVVHDAGLIHRDLKAANIFLARTREGDEICKLLDFGIARAENSSELTKTGVALGTPNYMSPEQASSGDIDRRTDIYSFGVLLFKLATGRLPFAGEPIQVAMHHCHTPPPVPSVMAPGAGISAALDAIILRAMAKDPRDRFQSMREVEAALVELLRAEAPELAPAVKSARSPGAGAHGRWAASAGFASPADAATPAGSRLPTGATEVMPPSSSRTSRWLLACVGVMSIAAVGVTALVLGVGVAPLPEQVVEPPDEARALEAVPPAIVARPRASEPIRREAETPASEPTRREAETPKLPPLEPEVPRRPKKAAEKPAEKPVEKAVERPRPPEPPGDPLKQIERQARACRKTHDAVDGPTMTIDYAIGIDGRVTRSIPATPDALGKCLAAAVMSTQFEPKVVLGRKIEL